MKFIAFLAALTLGLPAMALYTPQSAVDDALSDHLQLVGTFMPEYSDSQMYPTCIYRGENVMVVSDYCVKDNVPAAKVRVHSLKNNSYVEIYAETGKNVDVSTVERADYYDVLWSISSQANGSAFNFNMTTDQYQAYDDALVHAQLDGCVTGEGLQSYANHSTCSANYTSQTLPWGKKSYSYWRAPSSNWYRLLKALKAKTTVTIKPLP